MIAAACQNDLSPDTTRWFAILTRVKTEKAVSLALTRASIKNYVPLQKVVRVYTRKKRTQMLPLIYRYAFVNIRKAEYIPVLETQHVEGFVRFNKNLIAIPDQEIEWLQRVTGEINEIYLENRPFSPGEAVEVVLGNLTGLRGKLIRSLGKNELLIELDRIGFGLRIQIDPAHLRSLR